MRAGATVRASTSTMVIKINETECGAVFMAVLVPVKQEVSEIPV
jgi:hypothetical protein